MVVVVEVVPAEDVAPEESEEEVGDEEEEGNVPWSPIPPVLVTTTEEACTRSFARRRKRPLRKSTVR